MNTLARKLANSESGLRFFSFTPPRKGISADKLERMNERRHERIKRIAPDGIMIYDVQEENDRTNAERAFAYHPYLNAIEYADGFLARNKCPQIRYAALSGYNRDELFELFENNPGHPLVVVGYPGIADPSALNLGDVYELYKKKCYEFPLGGIAIAERHLILRNEAEAMVGKICGGVSFFSTQCIYNPDIFLRLLKDYKEECVRKKLNCKTVILTFSPVLAEKDTTFLEWLGIDVPGDFKKGLALAADQEAYVGHYLQHMIHELTSYCEFLDIPYGINIESVIARKAETDLAASIAEKMVYKGTKKEFGIPLHI
jgi:hypothetical protein